MCFWVILQSWGSLVSLDTFTIILWVASLYIDSTISFTFTLLVLGFLLKDLSYFGHLAMSKAAAYVLILGALNAWYMMAHLIYLDILGRDMLPLGKPWLNPRPRA